MFDLPLGFVQISSSWWHGNVHKNIYESIDFCAFMTRKFSMHGTISEKWFMVSEKSGNFFHTDGLQPCKMQYHDAVMKKK